MTKEDGCEKYPSLDPLICAMSKTTKIDIKIEPIKV